MPSTLTQFSSQIDINYPEVGKDNDTQGFRDNFSSIQSAFLVASEEITDLQSNGVKLTETNDFNYNILRSPILQNVSQVAKNTIVINSTLTGVVYTNVDYSEASYHKFNLVNNTLTNYYTFNVVNWPGSDRYAELKLQMSCNNTSTATITFGGTTVLLGNFTATTTVNSTGTMIYELWSSDNGSTVFGQVLRSV